MSTQTHTQALINAETEKQSTQSHRESEREKIKNIAWINIVRVVRVIHNIQMKYN